MLYWACLVAQIGKNPPAMWKTWVPSLDWEDPLAEGMTTHSSILSWRILWTEEPGRLWGHKDLDTTRWLSTKVDNYILFGELTWMWELDYKESWVPKNWCFWTVVLEKTLESPLDCKEIQPVHPKGAKSWVFIGKTDFEAQIPILWPPDSKSWLIWKDPDAGKDWGQKKEGKTEDEMVGWHHWLSGHGFGWTPGVGDGQAGLVCCGSWGRKESDMTERLNWTEYFTIHSPECFFDY